MMGSHGGVTWLPLRRGGSLDRAHALLAPWWSLTEFGLGSDDHDASRRAWLRANADDVRNAVTGGYGTDYGDRPTLDDLHEWVAYVEDAESDPARGLAEGATFDDLLLEIDTRPAGTWCGYDERRTRPWLDDLRRAPEAFRTQTLRSWVEALTREVYVEGARREETWT